VHKLCLCIITGPIYIYILWLVMIYFLKSIKFMAR
jgi:hypothetical protein